MPETPAPDDIRILVCTGCGRTEPYPTGLPWDLNPSEHCGKCPPWRCEDCGEMSAAHALCPCWARFDNLPMADIKGLLTLDGFQLDHRPPTAEEQPGDVDA